MFKKFFIIFFIFGLTINSFSQKINLQKFSVKEGLCQSTVKQIEQDNYGNLWLATSFGLSKFNGKTFENYTTFNGLPSNEIQSLLFNKDILFIGTRKGFCSFNGSIIENNELYKKIYGSVKKIVAYKNTIHILTNKGYFILDITSQKFTLDSVPIPNITSQGITDAEFDEEGNLWISTSRKGIFFIENNTTTKIPKLVLIQNAASSVTIDKKLKHVANFNSKNLLHGDAIMSLEFDNKFDLYLSDWNNGFAKFGFNTSMNYGFSANYVSVDSSANDNIAVSRYLNIQKDKEGNLFFATDGFGILKAPIDKNTNENSFLKNDLFWLNNNQGFYGNNPLCFKQDEDNNLWVGTLYDGLVVMNTKSSLSYNQKSGLEEEKVISTLYSSDSAIWLGTYGGGAFKFKNKKFTRSFWEQGITESIIKTIAEDGNGNIWLGTLGGGISIISKENANKQLQVTKAISETNNLSDNFVSFIYKATDGAMWIGFMNDNKINRIILNKDFTYNVTVFSVTNLATFNVNCITEDIDHQIWIATNEGVWQLNASNGHINNEYAIFKNIQTIAKDWNGNMWLGTSDVGILILKNKLKVRYNQKSNSTSVEKINVQQGLSSNCINTILFTNDVIWAVTNNGLNEIKIDKYLNTYNEIKNFSKGTGFASFDNKPNSAIIDNSGYLWIGSVEGLTQYKNVNSIDNETIKKPIFVFINAIRIENKLIDWSNLEQIKEANFEDITFDGFYNWYNIPKNLQLDNAHNTIQFYLNTNNIAEQKQINYLSKLIGFDKDWVQTNSSDLTYRNLPPGDYNLIIKASLSNEFKDALELNYHFNVKPPFWKTKLFYAIVAFLSIAFLYYYISNREKRLKREKLKLELLVKSRTQEIENKKREIEIQSALIQGINNDLTDSIKYAQRIQKTILPNTQFLTNFFEDYFILYKPRNIVSGDYYWMKEIDDYIYLAVVDCTGHGVPGAFMSLISSSILNESTNISISMYKPKAMLNYLRHEISIRLNQNNSELVNDGLDIALICYDKENQTIEYVNANRPMYIISDNELVTLQADKISIGGKNEEIADIKSKMVSVKKGDQLFLFTDGVTDQFGGDKNKKYNPSRLRQFLLVNNELPFKVLSEKLNAEITNWQGNFEQTDDILFVGLKV